MAASAHAPAGSSAFATSYFLHHALYLDGMLVHGFCCGGKQLTPTEAARRSNMCRIVQVSLYLDAVTGFLGSSGRLLPYSHA